MINDGSRIAELLADGDYFEALGVEPSSTATEIAVTAARLAVEHPDEARRINAIASVLRSPEQLEIYLIAAKERDDIVRALDPLLCEMIRDVRQRVWSELQRLLRCEFELAVVNIGPRAARSLAQHHEWVKETLINNAFPVVMPTPDERCAGSAYRRLTFERDCPACGSASAPDCSCNDYYEFAIPSGAAPGTVLSAHGRRTGRFECAILDRAVVAPRPYLALNIIYQHRDSRARLAKVGVASDITIEEAQRASRSILWMSAVWFAVSAMLGLLISAWLVGVLVALPQLGGVTANMIAYTSGRAQSSATRRLIWSLLLAGPPTIGALAGAYLATAPSGLLTGLPLSACVGLIELVKRRRRA